MPKILQARLQQFMYQELPDVQTRFRKSRGTRDQIANIHWIIEKSMEFQKKSISVSLTTWNPLTVSHNKLWKILKEMGLPDHFTCLLKNLYAGQEATVRTLHGTTDWFKIGKGVTQGCISSPYLFMCRVHHVKCWAGWITSWNQDCTEKYQQPEICR